MKNDRQLKILEIVSAQEIRTQEELILALRHHGFVATQATVSRDIKELHLQKVTTPDGGIKYSVDAAPKGHAPDTLERYRNVLTHVLVSAVPAGNIGVVKTLSGTANAAAAALESNRDFPEIIGTLAGDDTLLVLFSGERLAFDFCRRINADYIKN